jgi:hypothetical protein
MGQNTSNTSKPNKSKSSRYILVENKKSEYGINFTNLDILLKDRLSKTAIESLYIFLLCGWKFAISLSIYELGNRKKIKNNLINNFDGVMNILVNGLKRNDEFAELDEKYDLDYEGKFDDNSIKITILINDSYEERKQSNYLYDLNKVLTKHEKQIRSYYEELITNRVRDYATILFRKFLKKLVREINHQLIFSNTAEVTITNFSADVYKDIDFTVSKLPFLQNIFSEMFCDNFKKEDYDIITHGDTFFNIENNKLSFYCKVTAK